MFLAPLWRWYTCLLVESSRWFHRAGCHVERYDDVVDVVSVGIVVVEVAGVRLGGGWVEGTHVVDTVRIVAVGVGAGEDRRVGGVGAGRALTFAWSYGWSDGFGRW